MNIIKPKQFVNLHCHSTLSIGDALGYPKEHMDYVLEMGGDALALTDHSKTKPLEIETNCSDF